MTEEELSKLWNELEDEEKKAEVEYCKMFNSTPDEVPLNQMVRFRSGYCMGKYYGYLAGLHEGQPKWHKVADGDYPDTNRTVLAYSDDVVGGNYPYFAQYWKGSTDNKKNGVDLNWNCWRNNMQREVVEPTVWCELPQFKE